MLGITNPWEIIISCGRKIIEILITPASCRNYGTVARDCPPILPCTLRVETVRPGVGIPPKLGYGAQHKLKIWTLKHLTTSEKGGLKDLKRVFGKFEIGGLKYLNRVIDANC